MANRHIKELSDKVKGYFEELNRLDSIAVKISSIKMVDPDDWSELTADIRNLALYISNVNSVLAMALDPKDFQQALSSRRNLVKSLLEVIEKVKVEQPDSELLGSYHKVFGEHKDTLFLLEQTNKFRCFPKAKKKFNKLIRAGLVDKSYTPFCRIEITLLKIKNTLDSEVV